jgi:hypothetical protein
MARPLTELERLDLAADAMASHGSSGCNFLLLVIYPSALVWERLFHTLWIGLVCAGIAAAAALLYWRRNRFGILALAGVETAMAVLLVCFNLDGHHSLGFRLPALLLAAALAGIGVIDLKRGIPFARVHSQGWKSEREQVEKWLAALRGSEGYQRVTEIRDRTFTRGDRTYRFFDAGNCWAVAMFQTGYEKRRPITYHVREHNEVALDEQPGGGVTARVDGGRLPRGHGKDMHHWRPLAPKEM